MSTISAIINFCVDTLFKDVKSVSGLGQVCGFEIGIWR